MNPKIFFLIAGVVGIGYAIANFLKSNGAFDLFVLGFVLVCVAGLLVLLVRARGEKE